VAVRQSGILAKPDSCGPVVTHLYDLVSLALGVGGEAREMAQSRGLRAARRSAVLRFIKNRSGDPETSAITAAAALGVTPRYVHSLLEEPGLSFAHHVLERRLENTAAMLRDAERPNIRIAEIALAAGFNDLSYFNHAFRRHDEATPSEMRDAARRGEAAETVHGSVQ